MSSAMNTADPSRRDEGLERTAQAFERLAEPLRREIKLHCYRMLGSLHEAEDLVQESFLRAWRSFDSFEGGSFRAWFYKIATNACLNALESRKSALRFLPDQRAPAATAMPNGVPATDVAWLEPYPDSNLEGIADDAPNPEARYASREAVQLAFIAVIQQLPPRQRAVVLLCDVLGWSAVEAKTLLGGSTASINSALQRARETLAKSYPDGPRAAATTPTSAQQKLLGRYIQAWEKLDVDSFVALLKEDATYTMPPIPQWYVGREAIATFFRSVWKLYDGYRMVPTSANGQPAFAAYSRARADAPWEAHSIHVLTLENDSISRVTLFMKPEGPRLFGAFGLPMVLTP
jgi:RNA polymerase sigma-70 factor, ECF subfamily